jgi:hypothetical protein
MTEWTGLPGGLWLGLVRMALDFIKWKIFVLFFTTAQEQNKAEDIYSFDDVVTHSEVGSKALLVALSPHLMINSLLRKFVRISLRLVRLRVRSQRLDLGIY